MLTLILLFSLLTLSSNPIVGNHAIAKTDQYELDNKRTVVLNEVYPISEQLIDSGVLYVVQGLFDLEGKTVSLPSNSALLFDKGRLCNGVLNGNNTIIYSNRSLILSNIKLTGSFRADNASPEWFGAIGDGKSNDTEALKNLAKISGKVLFSKTREYLVNDYIFLKSNTTWDLNKSTICLFENSPFSLYISHAENVTIKNGKIIGNRIGEESFLEYGITIDASQHVLVEDVYFSKFSRDGIYIGYEWSDPDEESHKTNNVIVRNCIFDNVARNGIVISAGDNIEIANCEFKNIDTYYPKAGIDIEPENINKNKALNLDNISIHDCSFKNCRLAVSVYQSNMNYPNGNVYIDKIKSDGAILYIDNIKKDGGLNTYIDKVSFKNCSSPCIQIVNPSNNNVIKLNNITIKSFRVSEKQTAAVTITVNGKKDMVGGVLIDGIKAKGFRTSYNHVISVDDKSDRGVRMENVVVRNVKCKKKENGFILSDKAGLLEKGI